MAKAIEPPGIFYEHGTCTILSGYPKRPSNNWLVRRKLKYPDLTFTRCTTAVHSGFEGFPNIKASNLWEVTGPEKQVRLVYNEALDRIVLYRVMDEMLEQTGKKPDSWVKRSDRWQD